MGRLSGYARAMRDDRQTLDIVVRGRGLALTASAIVIEPAHLVLVGAIADSELPAPNGAPVPVSTVMNISLDQELAGGAHVQRQTKWVLEADDIDPIIVSWQVESHELPDGYALQDARARAGDLDIRAFAIEDLVATVGVGLAAGVAGLAVWLHHKRAETALKTAEREYRECLDAGGSPTIRFGVDDEASLTPDARLRIKSGVRYQVRCAKEAR